MTAGNPGRNEAQAKLWSMIKGIKVAIMTNWDGEAMHSRPMRGYQDEFEGSLHFFTRRDSSKTAEIDRLDRLNLAYADPDANTYVSIAGRSRIPDDNDRMRRYWSPMVGAWFSPGAGAEPQWAAYGSSCQSPMRGDTKVKGRAR